MRLSLYKICVPFILCLYSIETTSLFQLSIIHVNDIHARFEEISAQSTRCIKNCIGGISRMYYAVNSLMKQQSNSIFLNAGDSFQGTLWYNLYGWNVTQYFLNIFPTDAYVLGNHEFDDGISGIIPFMENLKCPIIVANIDAREEPYINDLFNKSVIIFRGNKKIGIIGVMASNTNVISNTGNLKFTSEVLAVNNEAEHLVLKKHCDIIIVLSHCGLDMDKIIATEANKYISVIVGGHSHTFLYSGKTLPGPDKPAGPYPIVIENRYRKVLIVQAALNTKYVGNLSVWYDKIGNIHRWSGNPLYLNASVPQDSHINGDILKWKKGVDYLGNTVIGKSKVILDRSKRRTGESNIGSFFADAMVDSFISKARGRSWTYAAIAVINSGSIRTSLNPGDITLYDLMGSQPFENSIDCVELSGQNIKDILEYSVTTSVYKQFEFHEFLQVSGIRVSFDTSKPVNSRVTKLKLRCQNCLIPNFEYVNYTEIYRVIMPSYLADGGDGYDIIVQNQVNRIRGEKDVNVYRSYIAKMSPIVQGFDERIIFENQNITINASTYNNSAGIILNNSWSIIIYMIFSHLKKTFFCL